MSSKVHQSKFRGASKHGGGKKAPLEQKDGRTQQPKEYGRFARHPGGEVPQAERSPKEQIAFLDSRGYVATKEREKLQKKIEKEKK